MGGVRGWVGAAMALVLTAPGFTGSARMDAGAAAPVKARVGEAPDEGTALRLAREQGTPVVVAGMTSETRLVKAEPSGRLTAELTAQPVRVKQGQRWADVDTTLVRRADGTIAPRAAATELVLSGGGDRALLRYGRDGRAMALAWPGDLPVPILTGDTATYREVLPGVDLRIIAGVTGYTQHLVVKTWEAASNPGLRELHFGLQITGVTVAATEGGGLELRDPAGGLVFSAPPARMWDSAEQPKLAGVGVKVHAGTLVLTPDQALLGDPAATLPIVIDPAPVHHDKAAWASVYSGEPNAAYWNDSADPANTAQVGFCGWSGCGTLGNGRTYFMYDTRWLGGKTYYGAWLNTTSVYGPGCAYHDHALYWVDGDIHPGTTWNSHPAEWEVDRKAVKSNQNCAGNVPVGFETRGHVRFGGFSTYMIRAVGEGDKYAWRKYDPGSTRLLVSYNTRPNAPYELRTVPQRPVCTHCDGKQWLGDDVVKLQTRLSDPDNDQVKPKWTVSGIAGEIVGPTKGSGELFEVEINVSGRADGEVVTWSARANDGLEDSGGVGGPGFAVDRHAPARKPIVRSKHYPTDNRWHGGVGVRGQFEFESDGVADIDHYDYGWDSAATGSVVAVSRGGGAKEWIAPPGDGPRALYVYSVDRAGRRSEPTIHHIYVRSGNGPLAQWSMEGNVKDTAFLGDRDGTLSGGANYTDGPIGSALALDAAAHGHVSAPNTVRTDSSFSVAVWVKIDTNTGARAIVSQDGTRFPGFALWFRHERGGNWVFGMSNGDGAHAGTDMAWDPRPGADRRLAAHRGRLRRRGQRAAPLRQRKTGRRHPAHRAELARRRAAAHRPHHLGRL